MLVRRCSMCGREIQLSLPYSNRYVRYNDKWYCADCFCAATNPKVDWFGRTREYVTKEVSKDNIYLYFVNNFHMCNVPKSVFSLLEDIYKGKKKGLAQPISPYELYDILEQKKDYILGRIRFLGIERDMAKINYALSVACGSYGEYKEHIAQVQNEQVQAKTSDNYIPPLRGYIPPNEPEKENLFIEPYDDDD